MLTEIDLGNFKCFRKLNLRPRLMTVLIGANGSGKSSCLQALLLLKQSLNTDGLVTHGEQIRLGEFGDILYRSNGGPADRSLKIGITGIAALEEPAKTVFGDKVPYTYSLNFIQGRLRDQACRIVTSRHGDIESAFSRGRKGVTPPQLVIMKGVRSSFGASEPIGQPIYRIGPPILVMPAPPRFNCPRML
jgi:energy-coupling factor transporter ATP-binding protein EcfA2